MMRWRLMLLMAGWLLGVAMPSEAAIVGYVDGLMPDGVAFGWLTNLATPDTPQSITLLVDGTARATLTADGVRLDVNAAGYTGNHGWQWRIPDLFRDGRLHVLSTDPVLPGSGTTPTPFPFTLAPTPVASASPPLTFVLVCRVGGAAAGLSILPTRAVPLVATVQPIPEDVLLPLGSVAPAVSGVLVLVDGQPVATVPLFLQAGTPNFTLEVDHVIAPAL